MTRSATFQPRPQILVAAAGLLAVSLLLTTVSRAAANPSAPEFPRTSGGPREMPVGLVASSLAKPHPVVGADGRRHLVYELRLFNSTSAAITVTRVKTVDPATGRVFGTLDAATIAALMIPDGSAPTPTLRAGQAGFILMEVSLPLAQTVPARLVHDFIFTRGSELGRPNRGRGGLTHVARDRAPVIGGPLAGPRWVVVNGCCAGPNSHRQAIIPADAAFYVSERFAIDFAQLTADRRVYQGDPAQLTSFPSYGAKIFSVGPGIVVGTQDGIVDNVPVGSLPPFSLETVGGNFVVVDLGKRRFAFYAHLQPGSLTVNVGDRVKQGQVLGLLGNSGNSDFPHLHFHVMDSPSPLESDGLPYEFASFSSEGTLANGEDVLTGGVAIFDPTLSGPHFGQLPLELQVIGLSPRPRGGR